MRSSFLFACLLSGATVFGQPLPEAEESGASYGICSVDDDLDHLLVRVDVSDELRSAGLQGDADQAEREIALLCRDRPSDQEVLGGTAASWLIRADAAALALNYVAASGVSEKAISARTQLEFARIALRLQMRLGAVRTLAYSAVRTEQVEVIREVPTSCEDGSERCDDILRPFIEGWAAALGRLTDNYDRANGAMKEAVRIKNEARAIGPDTKGLGIRVSNWKARLSDQLSLRRVDEGFFGLTDEENRVLTGISTGMESVLALCLQ